MTHTTLNGLWRLTDATGTYSCDMTLPGDAITALHAAGLIPDPYFGRNEYDLRWICDRDWTLTRIVTLDSADVDLVAAGLDTLAVVSLNGTEILNADNAFRTWRADARKAARKGENEIAIRFPAVTRATADMQAAQQFHIPFSHNCPIPNGNLIRKPACDFGWDWNIALAPFGVLGDIGFAPRRAPRIDRMAIAQDHAPGTVTLTVTAHLTHAEGAAIDVTFAGRTASGEVEDGAITVAFDIDNPALWWPVGDGAQVLHDLTVTCGAATETRRIGLRQVDLVTQKDDAGLGFAIHVNGHPTFMRGANWIPQDALAGRITRAATRRLLQSAVDANMNMIRVWGGGRYEATWFYDLCDEMGLMVWQDFMFACNIYPADRDFLDNVAQEVRENVARMHHHACLALWCGDNELIGALGWYPETVENRDTYLVLYDRLNRTVEDALRETDPNAVWWPSSPSPGPMNFGDAWHDDGSGDMHFWSVWHEGRDFDHYRDVTPRFCSEFGFQSYPSMEIVRKFAEEADWNIAAPVLESHQKNDGGNARIAETMFRYYRWPHTFQDFVWLSQVQQGEAIKTAVSHWRGHRPHCMGTLIWQLNDTWPVCSWSSLDHGGGWKLLHHMAKDFFARATVLATVVDGEIRLNAVNDGRNEAAISVTAEAIAMDGTRRDIGRGTARVGAGAVTILRVSLDDLAVDEILSYHWHGGDEGSDIFAPRPWKTYALPAPGLTHEIETTGNGHRLTISASELAFFVTAEASVPGRWSANAVHIRPGETAGLTFTPQDADATPTFTLRDLHTATH